MLAAIEQFSQWPRRRRPQARAGWGGGYGLKRFGFPFQPIPIWAGQVLGAAGAG
ncbi:MAG: hypothetical protein JW953_03365 [Anaerolineae bacterium]|nr:hypothetical protein [Anaerolineae bacterium]